MAGNHTTDVASPKNLPGDQKQKNKGDVYLTSLRTSTQLTGWMFSTFFNFEKKDSS